MISAQQGVEFTTDSDDPVKYAIIIYISKKHDHENSENEMIRMLTDLFDKRIKGAEKVMKLKSVYGLKIQEKLKVR
jgi:hypothetical protein